MELLRHMAAEGCDIEAGHKSRCNHSSQVCEAFLLTTITWEAHVSPLKQALEPHSSSCHNFWYPLCSCSKLSHLTLTGIGCLMLCPKIMHQVVAQNLIFKLTGCKMTQGLNNSGFRKRGMLILKIVQASMKKVQSSKV